MDDKKIIELYFNRDETAIKETSEKYGRFLAKISYNILGDTSDVQECVNDTYLGAWKTIPPKNPSKLSAFLAKLTRFISISRLRKYTADKRKGGEYALSLDELSEVVSGKDDPVDQAIENELADAINRFLNGHRKEHCDIFVMRYFYSDSISYIADRLNVSQSKVKTSLHRTRLDLADFLRKEGYDI